MRFAATVLLSFTAGGLGEGAGQFSSGKIDKTAPRLFLQLQNLKVNSEAVK